MTRLAFAFAVLLALSPAAFGQQCVNGQCPNPFGVNVPRASAPVSSRAVPASIRASRVGPVRSFFAERRGIRTVFLRR